jgi:hypothetical protein
LLLWIEGEVGKPIMNSIRRDKDERQRAGNKRRTESDI